MNFPLGGNCKFLRTVNILTLYVLLQGSSEVVALSTTEQGTAVTTAVSSAVRWGYLRQLQGCCCGH